MAKNKSKDKIPTKKEIKKIAIQLINALEYECVSSNPKTQTDEEFKSTFARVRDVASKKLLANLLDDNMTGILALKDVCRESNKLLEQLNDSNNGRTKKAITISWDD